MTRLTSKERPASVSASLGASAATALLALGCASGEDTTLPSDPGATTGRPGGGAAASPPGGDDSAQQTPGFGLAGSDPAGSIASIELVGSESAAGYDALGRALGAGEDLTPLPGYNQFWFAWSVFNHDSEIFGRDKPVDTADFENDTDCIVPCENIVLGCPGKDCIPAITDPVMVDPDDDRASYLTAHSFVVGVATGGDARAYPHNVLWWHEIVNDTVGGTPIAVTHCPLTFSSLGHDPTKFIEGETVELGVSGRLFNSNLVFYNRSDESFFSQLLGRAVQGEALGEPAPRTHVWEMTWAAWQAMFPESQVMSGDPQDTGHARDYQRYPYGDYFVDDGNTFRTTTPLPDDTYEAKELTYGIRLAGKAKAYAHSELAAWARRNYGPDAPPSGVVNDAVGGEDIAVVFDIDAGYVQAFVTNEDLELSR